MIYLDNCATTVIHDKALEIINDYLKNKYFNASALYKGAVEVNSDITEARRKIAECLDCKPEEVYFTSGGSESNNTAIFGAAKNKKGNIITTKGEHLSVYAPFTELKNRGYDVRLANLKKSGQVDLEHLKNLVDENTAFVSVIHAGNETGAVNDIKAVSDICKAANPKCIVHSDGVQAYLKRAFSVKELNVDLYSISGHKVHCPKGIGALYIKKGIKINPLIYGGHQENGLRAGTENAAYIAAFAEISRLLRGNIEERANSCKQLKDAFVKTLRENIDGFIVIAEGSNTLDNILSLGIENVKSEIIIQMMSDKGVYLGSGSACSARSKQSRVLRELNITEKYLNGSIRVCFSQYNDLREVVKAAENLAFCVKSLRSRIDKGV